MEVNIQNKVSRKLKSYRFKLRHAPYLTRCVLTPGQLSQKKRICQFRYLSFYEILLSIKFRRSFQPEKKEQIRVSHTLNRKERLLCCSKYSRKKRETDRQFIVKSPVRCKMKKQQRRKMKVSKRNLVVKQKNRLRGFGGFSIS